MVRLEFDTIDILEVLISEFVNSSFIYGISINYGKKKAFSNFYHFVVPNKKNIYRL